MKATFLGAVGALLLLAAVETAHAQPAYIGGLYQRSELDTPAGSGNSDGVAVEGAVTFAPTATLGLDLNAAYSDTNQSDDTTGIAGHLYAKGADYKFGGFVAAANANSDTYLEGGVEGQKSWDAWTLAGVVSYANLDDANVDAWGGDAQVRYFFGDDLRLDGKAGWHNVDFSGAVGDDDVWNLGVGGEWRWRGSPVSLTAGYDHYEFDSRNVDADVWTIGARWNFGGSLKERDRDGPSFGGLSSLTRAVTF
jgi:hypothetical protein